MDPCPEVGDQLAVRVRHDGSFFDRFAWACWRRLAKPFAVRHHLNWHVLPIR